MINPREKAEVWLKSSVDEETKKEIISLLLPENERELQDAFYKNLEFGTGGLRGIMGAGTNRMNRYTVGMATQGLANYILSHSPSGIASVVVGHDCRLHSREFAEVTADVFSANGIKVYLFNDLRPTPEVSFAIRSLGCQSGVVLTASHNPKEYNGYKAYWNDGAQLTSPHDKGVMEEVAKITSFDKVRWERISELIFSLGDEMDTRFLHACKSQLFQADSPKSLKIVFSALHGTGTTLIPQFLKKIGYTQLIEIEEQALPDGQFPTVMYPNPEEAEAMQMAVQKATQTFADLVVATDPDADRVGIAIKSHAGHYQLLNGNQTGAMVMDYLIRMNTEHGRLTGDDYIVKTIVTTELIQKIAQNYSIPCYDTLTGFKYIATLIREKEGKEHFLAGCEESYGFMIGDFVRDKDGITATAILAEMGEWLLSREMTYEDYLIELYQSHGFYKEKLISITKKGKEGAEAIKKMMEMWRKSPLQEVDGEKVTSLLDYQKGTASHIPTQTTQPLHFPSSNVLQFLTEKGTLVSARPSGTEPKIKFYISVNTPLNDKTEYRETEALLDAKLNRIEKELLQF
jgi:phosphoglucomutase